MLLLVWLILQSLKLIFLHARHRGWCSRWWQHQQRKVIALWGPIIVLGRKGLQCVKRAHPLGFLADSNNLTNFTCFLFPLEGNWRKLDTWREKVTQPGSMLGRNRATSRLLTVVLGYSRPKASMFRAPGLILTVFLTLTSLISMARQ